jgi:hypothetical protein
MIVAKASHATTVDLLPAWRTGVLSGTPPTLYPVGVGELARIEVGPGLVTLIGGAPSVGKTAFTMQAVVDALRLTPTLRALVCNVEMPPMALLDRQLARLSGVSLTSIRYGHRSPSPQPRRGIALAGCGCRLAGCHFSASRAPPERINSHPTALIG